MGWRAIAILVVTLSGCAFEERYLVDRALLEEIGRTPAPELVNVGVRRVGDLVVQIACDDSGTYSGTVAGEAGTWDFEQVTMPETTTTMECNSRAALDRMAAHVASLYFYQRGTVAAYRAADSEKVQVRLSAFDFSTTRTKGKWASVVARGRSGLWWAPGTVAPTGLALLAGGLALISQGRQECTDGPTLDLLGCQLFGGESRPFWGGLLTVVGSVTLLGAGALALVAATRHPQEIGARSTSFVHLPRPPRPSQSLVPTE